ncbi:hypothetical protein BCR32DRAFT_248991 [Anaeromyces robustus]|uniref:Uncharacterized protein n=1 Tax=Anaeromyces robustus TaxID=1754192 RepID=A0A1Y1WS90_9FUNG|nr:hypothetical protein BCR32DRAFT_248991 [Anaeromyces robustus]|eukprot:ORX76116.1 hypothetical protein BCR32DRAFT_248991 [Anaeromyces robustus]
MENLKIEFSETNKGKEQVVINRKYKFNLRYIKKDNLKYFHCDFEKAISNAIKKIFTNINIRYCEYDIKYWNYYNGIEHIANNVSESFNKYLKLLFQNKLTFYKLIHKLKKEESLSFNDYQRRNEGILSKKRKIFRRTDQINILIGMYKEAESNLINNECDRNEIIELWFECLNILNSNFINLISI